MYYLYFGLGALAGALLVDRRMLFAVIIASCSLVFLGLRDHLFQDLLGGLLWFVANLACFELGLVLGGFAIVSLRQYVIHRPDVRAIPRTD